jgi:hypothetical protein
MTTTPTATPTESGGCTELPGTAAAAAAAVVAADAPAGDAACPEPGSDKKRKPDTTPDASTDATKSAGNAAADAKTAVAASSAAKPAKKHKPAASDDKRKFHPTGEKRGYQGKCKGGLILLIEDFSEPSECPQAMVVYMDKKGALSSMHGEALELSCSKTLRKFLKKCVEKDNTMVRFRHEDSGMQNGVHADMLQRMIDDAEEKDEELDDDSFAEEVHDLVDALADKFEWVDNCPKTCCQPADLHLLVHRCD